MSIHFAASRRLPGPVLARYLVAPQAPTPANDNPGAGSLMLIDTPLLRATLEHFAEHGLAAASQAMDLAEQALQSSDADAYRHWLAVCRMLDRRMAWRLSAGRPFGSAAGRPSRSR